MTITPSSLQSDIYKTVLSTNSNIVIEATAGSGKTTTIVEAAKILPRTQKILFTSFNKSIVDTLVERLPPYIKCATMHSMGFTTLIKHVKAQCQLDEFKTFIFADQKFRTKRNVAEKYRVPYNFTISAIINFMRMNLSERTVQAVEEICDRYDILPQYGEVEDSLEVFSHLTSYNRHLTSKSKVDFTDMLYLPLTLDHISFPKFDTVFLDEGQDANKLQQRLIEKMLKPNGRTIVVGDKNQCIYSFSGSNPEVFQDFINKDNTISLPLSISYRCPKRVVAYAAEIYDDIKPYDKAEEGVVRHGTLDEINEYDMVICRNTRPLIHVYFQLLERQISATIIGKDIEVGLKKVIANYSNIPIDTINERLLDQLDDLSIELKAKGVKKPNKHTRYIEFDEKIKAIEVLGKGLQIGAQIEKRIEEMFKDKKVAAKLYTGHRSKGLENDRVFFIESFEGKKLIPSPYATQAWQLEQENNLLFVIRTRAKKEFITISNVE